MNHLSSHMGAEDLPLRRHQQVHIFHHVQEQLVPPVLDPLLPPPDLTSDLAGDSCLLLLGSRFHSLLCDECLQDACVCVLWVTKVHNLVQKLIYQDKVVLHILLRDLAKVVLHDFDNFEEELEHHGCVDILLGDRCQPEVGALDVEEGGACNVGHG